VFQLVATSFKKPLKPSVLEAFLVSGCFKLFLAVANKVVLQLVLHPDSFLLVAPP